MTTREAARLLRRYGRVSRAAWLPPSDTTIRDTTRPARGPGRTATAKKFAGDASAAGSPPRPVGRVPQPVQGPNIPCRGPVWSLLARKRIRYTHRELSVLDPGEKWIALIQFAENVDIRLRVAGPIGCWGGRPSARINR